MTNRPTRVGPQRYEYLGYLIERPGKTWQAAPREGWRVPQGLAGYLSARTLAELVEAIGSQMVTRTNLMSNREYQERLDTPHYCSPSCESYWTM